MNWREGTLLGVRLPELLRWSGRANRRQFLVRYLAICAIGVLLGAIIVLPVLWIGEAIWSQSTASTIAFALHCVLLAALLVVTSAPLAQRAHDMGISARVSLAVYGGALAVSLVDWLAWPSTLIPDSISRLLSLVAALFCLWLLVGKGQPHANRFGEPP